MPLDHPVEYWQAVARGLEAESQKAAVYVRHAASLGVSREAIFRVLIDDQTPGPFLVKTGQIRWRDRTEIEYSKQCDLLVYNPHIDTPYYRMDEFVVVPRESARIVVEVKSALNKADLEQVVDVWGSTRPMRVPTLGFAYEGMTFDTFVGHLADHVRLNSSSPPFCIAVHDRNYLSLRATHWGENCPYPCFALDFSHLGEQGFGMATAYFLQWYFWLLTREAQPNITEYQALTWFNNLNIDDAAKRWIDSDGTVHIGRLVPPSPIPAPPTSPPP